MTQYDQELFEERGRAITVLEQRIELVGQAYADLERVIFEAFTDRHPTVEYVDPMQALRFMLHTQSVEA
jgi:hypothetical protein